MIFPMLNGENSTRDFIEAFGGYNHNLRINDGEFYDMKNLTSSFYPLLAPRKPRGKLCETSGTPMALIEKDALCHVTVEGGNLHFYMNGYDYDLGMTTIDKDVRRSLTSMGAYVIIMPDKKYINTAATKNGTVDTDDKGNIEATYTSIEGENIQFEVCRADGTTYEDVQISDTEPEGDIENGCVWLDTSVTPNSLKVYSKTNGMWSAVATTYIKISAAGIGAKFDVYDGVQISGIEVEQLLDLNNNMIIYAKEDDYIVVVGVVSGGEYEFSQDKVITLKRLMPEMDFIIESNNRLWGCHYGLNREGDMVNEIYASRQGNFKSWDMFLGTAQDSYYASVGTDGQFTGAISYLGQPLFFKENCMHLVQGSYPAQYRILDTACRGVQKGSENSLAMVNEVLYYKSRTGVCAYNGALPTEISANLGDIHYSKAVACGHKNKYYISMLDSRSNEYEMFVFDTEKGLWHKEDNQHILGFCSVNDELYYIDGSNNIFTMFGSGTTDTSPIEWMAETGTMGCSAIDKKYISKLSLRLSMDVGTRVYIFIEYDSTGTWEAVSTLAGYNLRTFTVPIKPKRCDHLRLKIVGKGNAKIYSISKTLEQGSDI